MKRATNSSALSNNEVSMDTTQLAGYTHILLITGSRSWDSEITMQHAFNQAWAHWGPQNVIKPLLISGHCPDGADAMAERLWAAAGFDYLPVQADWNTHGNRAGILRNQQMVNIALDCQGRGAQVLCQAFLCLCTRHGCTQREYKQLAPTHYGHFSHGTAHCRQAALTAGISTIDVITPVPF